MFSVKKIPNKFTTVLAVIVSFNCHAAESGHFGAHVHGQAQMTIAQEGINLFIDFISPADSITGFEHVAQSEKEIAQVKASVSWLKQTKNLFTFIGSTCVAYSHDIDVSGLMIDKNDHDEHKHHDEHSHEHHDKHSHEHHDEHSHEHHDEHSHEHHDEHSYEHHDEHSYEHHDEHSHEHHDEHSHEHHDEPNHEHHDENNLTNHAEVIASYRYTCNDITNLTGMTVKFFSNFPKLEKIDAVWLIGNKQGVQTLTSLATVSYTHLTLPTSR